MGRLEGKTAIVTGSGEGIGKAIAKVFAQEGAKVAITCRRENVGKEVAKEINEAGGEAFFWKLDVSNEENCKEIVEAVEKKWGKLDILVNNAGFTGVDKPTTEMTESEWDAVFNVDVKGVFFMTKYSVPAMKRAGKGSIINMSSIYGLVGSRELTAYHAAKGAVTTLTKREALCYAPDHIRVNSVHPGTIVTPLFEKLAEENKKYVEEQLSRAPIGYLGEPEDIAYGCVYLASDEAKFVTGTQLVIDGGYTAQ